MDLVSIVIPCYNPSEYLLEAIASVSAQTHRDTEIIVVNDGSDRPESRAVLEEAARRVQGYLEQSNQGLGAARNAGIRAARGQYIAPLDADDLLEPGCLAECLAALKADASAAFAYGDYRVFGSQNYLERAGEYNLYTLLERNFLTYAALIRKQDWEQAGGYDEAMRLGYEDWEFWLRLGSRGRFGQYVPKPLFRYRKHGASLYDVARAHHQEIVAYIQSRHPELYGYQARARVKACWAPAVCIVGPTTPVAQSIEDVQVIAADGAKPSAPAFLVVGTGVLDSHSAELAALAVWSGHESVRLPDGSNAVSREGLSRAASVEKPADAQPAAWNKLHRHLLNAELLSARSWIRHPLRSVARLIPLRVKERVNRTAGRPVFDLSFYLQFQPNSLLAGNSLMEPLRYCPRPAGGRKRVAFLTPHLGPGGAEAVLWEIASTLSRKGFETLLLATHSRDERWLNKWRGPIEHVYDLAQVVSVERMAAAVCSVVSNWRCDFVLVQNSLYGYAALPHIRRFWPAAKIIDVVHNLDDDWDQIASTAEVAGCIDVRVAVSGSIRGRLLAAGTPEGQVRLLRSGVDLLRFQPAPVHSAEAAKQILFAGRLDPVKRPLLLVEIASELAALRPSRDFHIIIAGDGPEQESLRRRVRQAGLESIFDIRGQVEDLAPLYAASDLVIVPSRSEGVPLVVLEALACSRPVVASNVGAIHELLDSSCGVLVDVTRGEAAVFACALDTLLNQPELRAQMGAAGRRIVELGYDVRQARAGYARLVD